MILALESQDVKQITTIKQVLSECIQTRGIKVEELPSFDIEYLFLNVRGKSVGESIDLIVTCEDDGETEVPVKVFVDQVDVQFEEDHSPEIKLDDSVVLKMKYPSLDQFIKNNFDFNEQESVTLLKNHLKLLRSASILYLLKKMPGRKDCTKKELLEFIEGMNSSQFKMVEKFFETMPKLSHTFTVKNPKTKKENTVTLEGLTSFFDNVSY